MSEVFTYKFSEDFSEITANNTDGVFVGSLNLKNGEYCGKRGRPVASTPAPFRLTNARKLINYYSSTMADKVMGWLITTATNHNAFVRYLNDHPDFYKFLEGATKINHHICPSLFGLYAELQKMGKTAFDDEDIEYINLLYKMNVYGISEHFSSLCNYKTILFELDEHPTMKTMITNMISRAHPLPKNCTPESPSLNWYLAIAHAIINDGLDEFECATTIFAGQNSRAVLGDYQYRMLIDEYYQNLVAIGEYQEEPISENFFMELARTRALKEAIYEAKLETFFDKSPTIGDVTIGDYSYRQIKTYEELKSISHLITYHKDRIIHKLKNGEALIYGTIKGATPFIFNFDIDYIDPPFFTTYTYLDTNNECYSVYSNWLKTQNPANT